MRPPLLRLVSACCLSAMLLAPLAHADESSSSSASSEAASSSESSVESSSASSVASSAASSAESSPSSSSSAATGGSPFAASVLQQDTLSSSAAYVPHGKAKLAIEQNNEEDLTALWTLVQPDGTKVTSNSRTKIMTVLAGNYTIFVEKIKGTSASLRLFSGKTELRNSKRPQMTFMVGDGDDLRLSLNFPFTRVGVLSVNSDPAGIAFTLTTPHGTKETGVTPISYDTAAEGNYSITYEGLEGCPPPKPTSGVLVKDSRLSFDIRIDCAAADAIRAQATETEESFVTTKIGADSLAFTDVPQEAWYAVHMYNMAAYGILTGYSDAQGNPLGLMGPGNDVSIAELAKIAHKVGGIDERDHEPYDTLNRYVHAQWFAPFMVSAEARGWALFMDPLLKPDRPATRAEVLGTLYQAMDIRSDWPKGGIFADVNARTPFAGSVETAARAGVVDSGATDVNGSAVFHPASPINRAELAKMIDAMIDLYKAPAEDASSEVAE